MDTSGDDHEDNDFGNFLPPVEACTPGFWQGPNEGRLRWDENGVLDGGGADPEWGGIGIADNPFNTENLFYDYFSPEAGSLLDGLTMGQLIEGGPVDGISGGDIIRKSARFAIAAALNAEWGMNFEFASGADVQAAWQDAVDGTITFQELFNDLSAAFADKDCPIPPLS